MNDNVKKLKNGDFLNCNVMLHTFVVSWLHRKFVHSVNSLETINNFGKTRICFTLQCVTLLATWAMVSCIVHC